MCALPKGYRKNISLSRKKEGVERRQELLDKIDDHGTYFPKGVLYEDMDKSLVDYVNEEFDLTLEGEKVPVIFFTIQRWSEFSKTWLYSDKYKNMKLPFITVVRKPDTQVGTMQGSKYNIPQSINLYRYIKVPTFEGGRKGVDVYKIPQPTSVDVNYEVRLFTNRMRDVNKINEKFMKEFNSNQKYIFPNGHPMPLYLDGVEDKSVIKDLDDRRYYIQQFNIKLLGYLLYEDDFEVMPTLNRLKLTEELIVPKIRPTISITKIDEVQNIELSFVINARIANKFRFKCPYEIEVKGVEKDNIFALDFLINDVVQTIPFTIRAGDYVYVDFSKPYNEEGTFVIRGIL